MMQKLWICYEKESEKWQNIITKRESKRLLGESKKSATSALLVVNYHNVMA